MNHFPEVLEIIGLKPEEKFDLIDASGHILLCNVRFTDTGSLIGADEQSVPNDAILLRDVIRGIYTVQKKRGDRTTANRSSLSTAPVSSARTLGLAPPPSLPCWP